MKRRSVLFTFFAILVVLAACTSVEINGTDMPEITPEEHVATVETKDILVEELDPTPTQILVTPTPKPQIIEAVVWQEYPQIPFLNFHRFTPRLIDEETGTLMQLESSRQSFKSFMTRGGIP